MSRIGLKPIEIPAGVEVKVNDGNLVHVKGPKGELTQQIDQGMTINIDNNTVVVSRPSDSKKNKSLHGLSRSLLENMIVGVTDGYKKTLVIEGTGYRAAKAGKKLTLNLGYSHPIEVEDPEGIEIEVPDAHTIVITGIDKQKVGNFAANIRDYRKPEPYKGKGVRYENEYIRRKVGKTGK
ncbi:MAG: 50S ribosomal protein L6 [Miniphocaeibacter sp.]|uniref:50S ribosomal protein L6 n=1 Tax=Miniphocaeibacter halophilus TaxID=2931922 RepID=A0AC61MNA0_9FIRM|nr:50S ribosomal protein L6 [Miniphocaeibacter halophilus]QQK07062.1 50S ribosomal protein L6 [Miniphocaeibacter halophilus]HHX67051.1 50S ribosomal protein L6 [Gallicola sp.]